MLQLRLAIRQWVGPINQATAPSSRMLARSLLSSRLYSTDTPTPPAPELSEAEQNIYQKLTEKFTPSTLRVQDVSGGCGSFYAIIIASDRFKGLSMVKQHQLVNEALKVEIETIHGLQLKTIVPE